MAVKNIRFEWLFYLVDLKRDDDVVDGNDYKPNLFDFPLNGSCTSLWFLRSV